MLQGRNDGYVLCLGCANGEETLIFGLPVE